MSTTMRPSATHLLTYLFGLGTGCLLLQSSTNVQILGWFFLAVWLVFTLAEFILAFKSQ